MTEVAVNLNDIVYVQLTDRGQLILMEHFAQCNQRATDDHWSGKFQLWELFEIFGPHTSVAMQTPFFWKNKIIVNHKKPKKHKKESV